MKKPANSSPIEVPRDVLDALRRGRADARERLAGLLQEPLRSEAARFLGGGDGDVDDVVQETILATMQYLARDVEFTGDPVSLAMTIARNRCRDIARWRRRRPSVEVASLADWLAAPEQTVLDELEHAERRRLLQHALDRLGDDCRRLLQELFLEQRPTEEVRQRLGLGTVQGVYYRKAVCLRKLRSFFHDAMTGRSSGGDEMPTDIEDGARS